MGDNKMGSNINAVASSSALNSEHPKHGRHMSRGRQRYLNSEKQKRMQYGTQNKQTNNGKNQKERGTIDSMENVAAANSTPSSNGELEPRLSPSLLAPSLIRESLVKNCSRTSEPLEWHQLNLWLQLWLTYVERIGLRLGVSPTAVGETMSLFQRFYIFYPQRHFHPRDIGIVAYLVTLKSLDCHRKIRDIQIAAHEVMVGKNSTENSGSISSSTLESQKRTLLDIERLVLLVTGFDLRMTTPSSPQFFGTVQKLSHHFSFQNPSAISLLSHCIGLDSFKSLVHLSYPPHIIAIACVHLATFFIAEEPNSSNFLKHDDTSSFLTRKSLTPINETTAISLQSTLDQVHSVCQDLLDHYLLVPDIDAIPITIPDSSKPSHAKRSRTELDPTLAKFASTFGFPSLFWGHVHLAITSTRDFVRLKNMISALNTSPQKSDGSLPFTAHDLYDVSSGRRELRFIYTYEDEK